MEGIKYTDIRLVFAGNKFIDAHKYKLAKDSTYFSDFFSDNNVNIIDLSKETIILANYDIFVIYIKILYNIKILDTEFVNYSKLLELYEYINSKKIIKNIKSKLSNFSYSSDSISSDIVITILNCITNNYNIYMNFIVEVHNICKNQTNMKYDKINKMTINTIITICSYLENNCILNEKNKNYERNINDFVNNLHLIDNNKIDIIIYIFSNAIYSYICYERNTNKLYVYINEKFKIENVIKYFPHYHTLHNVYKLKTYVSEKK